MICHYGGASMDRFNRGLVFEIVGGILMNMLSMHLLRVKSSRA